MAENLKLARLFLLMLAIVTIGRWTLGAQHVPYEKGTDKLSIVMLTLFASFFYAAFTRRWLGFRILQAVGLTMTLAVLAQTVILLSTAVSYGAGLETYFNYPLALNQKEPVAFGTAMGIRLGGLVANTITGGIAGALGWAMGALLPPSPAK